MQSEARIQQDAFTEVRNKYPETYGCLFAIPNGGLRDAVFMRGGGVVPGEQDLMLLWAKMVYPIEVKTPTGTCSTDQKLIHAIHDSQGFKTYLFTTSGDIVRFVECVIAGGDINQFVVYISPFSNAEMVPVYRQQLREERSKKLKKVA